MAGLKCDKVEELILEKVCWTPWNVADVKTITFPRRSGDGRSSHFMGLLYRLRRKGKTKAEITEMMVSIRSMIYRELERKTGELGYRLKQRSADEHRLACRKLSIGKLEALARERFEKP
jgi:hypothetical protein